ncbi:baseplate assembly protein [Methylobacter tundripaludum]|uniref:Baseplate J family protein n=1 Tax=Methylobacter tundripaludum (strain ATCC BAA-1195 / DSM 17260 / SV96) TaxID=697282 RepID=G3IRF3_METTV|nr:baseplate J/gp47 family protein [Methylobacter tundripaludum]EGW22164.1 Baseplate J family protein [Methylobacter tundripaludum SV96]
MSFTQIDLSQIPAPNIVEALSFETIFAEMLADLQSRDNTFTALLESDPAYKVLEVAAYRELVLRQRVNDAARGVMLATARRTDLDQIGANYNVERLLITPADPTAIPPVAAVFEQDEPFKRRIQLAFEGLTTAGSEGSYIFHGLSASGDVADIAVDSVEFHLNESGAVVIDYGANLLTPEPGMVAITVLSRIGNGAADAPLLSLVDTALRADKVRPLTDRLTVRSVEVIGYTADATLYFYDGPSSATALQAAAGALDIYIAAAHKIGEDITLAGIYAALKQPGVQNVILASPVADIVIGNYQVGYCTGVTLTNGGVNV